jgi:hypothetical protein
MKRKFILLDNFLVSQQENEPDHYRAAIYPPSRKEIEAAITLVNEMEEKFDQLHREGKLLTPEKQPTATATDWLNHWSNSLDQMKTLVSNPVIHTPTIAFYSWSSKKPTTKQYLRNYRLATIHQLMERYSEKQFGKWYWYRHSENRDIRDYLYRDSPEPGGGNVFGQIRLEIPLT